MLVLKVIIEAMASLSVHTLEVRQILPNSIDELKDTYNMLCMAQSL